MTTIGPSFPSELKAAGLGALPISYDGNGIIGAGGLTQTQRAALDAVIAAHNSNTADPDKTRSDAMGADPDVADLLNRARTQSAAQINTWMTNATVAQRAAVLAAVVKYIATKL